MSRSNWKPLFIHNSFFEQQKLLKPTNDIIIFNRATKITKQMVGLKVQIYNGIKLFPITLNNDMIGHCLGEFAPTRKKHIAPKKKIQQK